MATKAELINSEEFENALSEGAECKKDMVTSYKQQNKSNYTSFYEVMLAANEDVQRVLSTKKKSRTEADTKLVEDFKKEVRQMYVQVQALTVDERLEEGKKTKIEKIVDKLVPVLSVLRYIGNDKLDKELAAHGIKIACEKLEDKMPALADDAKKQALADILTSATKIKQKVFDDSSYINEDLFLKKVPAELQYDKGSNNAGLKTGDWRKLVDAKAKLIMASTDEAKEKAEERIEHIASEKQFEAARAELVRDKLTKLQ